MIYSKEQARLNLISAVRLIDKYFALKYDPDQPRDEAGRWTDGGGGSESSGGNGVESGSMSVSLQSSINEHSDKIRGDSKENAFILNKDGEEILSRRGDEYGFKIHDDEAHLLKDAIVIHNHPGDGDLPFSIEDIQLMNYYESSEIIAVSGNIEYRMVNNFKVSDEDLGRIIYQAHDEVFPTPFYDLKDYDKVWKIVAEKTGFVYTRTEKD